MVVGVEIITRKTPLMTKCNQISFEFPSLERRKIEASFSGGLISSDGGALFLRQADRLLGLTKSISKVMIDPRQSGRTAHSTLIAGDSFLVWRHVCQTLLRAQNFLF